MPIYEYYCYNCQEVTEILYPTIKEAKKCKKKEVCYRCGKKVKKMISEPAKPVIR